MSEDLNNGIIYDNIDINKYKYKILYDNNDNFEYNFKIILIGDSGVGKTNLSNRAIRKKFDTSHCPTIGFEFFTFIININNKIIRLQIWDTCGQEVYRSLIQNFYKNASLTILVYSIDDRNSFEEIEYWYNEVKKNSGYDMKYFLIGNKNDLTELRKVPIEEGKKFYDDYKFNLFCETSAKTNYNIEKIFIKASILLYDEYINNEVECNSTDTQSFHINDKKTYNSINSKNKKKCC